MHDFHCNSTFCEAQTPVPSLVKGGRSMAGKAHRRNKTTSSSNDVAFKSGHQSTRTEEEVHVNLLLPAIQLCHQRYRWIWCFGQSHKYRAHHNNPEVNEKKVVANLILKIQNNECNELHVCWIIRCIRGLGFGLRARPKSAIQKSIFRSRSTTESTRLHNSATGSRH